jgi:AcrR family transcriptional regulator
VVDKKQADAPLEDRLWRRRAVERSLQEATARVHGQAEKFIAVGKALLDKYGSEFTLQDVADRTHTSLRTFYQFFSSKDEFVLSLFEEGMAGTLVQQLRDVEAAGPDPTARLRAFLQSMWVGVEHSNAKRARALVVYHRHLSENRPAELISVLDPMHRELRALLDACRAETGVAWANLDPSVGAALLLQTLISSIQASILNSEVGQVSISWTDFWTYVSAGLTAGRTEREPRRRRTVQRRPDIAV